MKYENPSVFKLLNNFGMDLVYQRERESHYPSHIFNSSFRGYIIPYVTRSK